MVGSTPQTLPLGRDSVTYRLSMEPFNVVVGGPRALLLQVMHPAVGAGVAQHSDYERDPWSRLLRTLTTMTQLAMGRPEVSQQMSRLLRRSHAAINGTQEDGRPYRALDPENMLWVWATLLDTIISVADTFVRPLTREERSQLYEEWVLIAEACGVPRDTCPPDVEAFRAYVASVMEHELVVTTTAKNIATTLRRPPLPPPLRQAASALISATLPGQLPERLRGELGIDWDPSAAGRYATMAGASRLACRVTPGPLRRLPGAIALVGTLKSPPPRPRRRLQTTSV